MYEVITPAQWSVDAAGLPFSTTFGDVYHSHDGGPGQARHVFLGGNRLPQRWQGRRQFTVLETGFGLGLNFLATWAAWRADPARCERLHFVSVEKHPFSATDLAALQRGWHEFGELSAQLVAAWPPLVPGMHRLHFDDGRVTLSLLLGDATRALEQIDAQVDAFYLDGFSPARNPELWSPRICHLLARLAAPQATLATWSVAGAVREALGHAGFEPSREAGFGGKREMLTACLSERAAQGAARRASPPVAERHALVIGAGLAGSAVAQRLAERGWRIEIIDEAAGPGEGASGNLAGVLRPLPSLDDNRLARLTRAGTLYGLRHLNALGRAGHPVRWAACGVLHLARDPIHEQKQRQVVEHQQAPAEFLRFVDRTTAAALADWPVATGGWWFPSSGWVMPPSLCTANLAAGQGWVRAHFGRQVARLERHAGNWQAFDAAGALIAAAPVAILASGAAIGRMPQAATLPVRSARGQVTHLAAPAGSAPRVVVCRLGYVTPAIDGLRCAGASYAVDDPETDLRAADQQDNLARLDYILPGFTAALATPALAGRVGFRPASPDRLPIVGALPTGEKPGGARQLADLPQHPGLHLISGFGARGLVWSSLAAELLASRLEGEPLPIESDLAAALEPGRFLLKPVRSRPGNDE